MKEVDPLSLFLAILVAGCTSSTPQKSPAPYREITIYELKNAKIGSSEEAESMAMHKMQNSTTRYGMRDAMASGIRAGSCFVISFDIPDFASKGDRIWPVNEYWIGSDVCTVWVNAETGIVRVMTTQEQRVATPVKYRVWIDNQGMEKKREQVSDISEPSIAPLPRDQQPGNSEGDR